MAAGSEQPVATEPGADDGGYVLGVDLGTTFTAAAVARDGRAEIVSLGHVSAVVPSVVFARDDGEMLVGDAAERRGGAEPARVGREFKRRLGDPVPLVLGGTPFGAEALTGQLLRHVYERVVEQQGGPPTTTVVTHPANYGDYKLDLLREAVRLADIGEVEFVTEPEAAATHYAEQNRLDEGDVVAVYDFGGGTFDAALVRRTASGFELIGTPEGMERLGGIDFDQAVFSHVVATLGGVDAFDQSDEAVLTGLTRLRDESRRAKEALSSDTDADLPVLLPGLHTDVRITRAEFEEMIRPRITETIDSLRRAIRSAGLSEGDVTRILLVGGSSRIPLVGEMLAAATGRPVTADAHPKHAIALGAALSASHAGPPAPPAVTPPVPPPMAPPPAPPADVPTENDETSKRPLVIGAVVALVAAAGLAFLVLGGGDGDEDATDTTVADTLAPTPETDPAATEPPTTDAATPQTTVAPSTTEAIVAGGEVFLLALDDPGDAPFTDSVAAEPSPELRAFAAAGPAEPTADDDGSGAGGEGSDAGGDTVIAASAGTEAGVFAGERGIDACRPDELVEQLAADTSAAAAWATVHQIEPADIAQFVDGLTATNLSSDTRVTDHDIVEGEAQARQAVLQIGTAVMIDEFGLPRVRCASGSPLLLPEPVEGTTSYVGSSWDTFTPERTAVVVPAPEPVAEFVLTDVAGGEPIVRPVGSSGADDPGLLPGEIIATGTILSLADFAGPFDTNEITITFSPTGGPATGTFTYSVSQGGVTLVADGELTGTYDPVAFTMAGTGVGTVSGGGINQTDTGTWNAVVDPASGTINGTVGDGGDVVTYELTFEPFDPPQN